MGVALVKIYTTKTSINQYILSRLITSRKPVVVFMNGENVNSK